MTTRAKKGSKNPVVDEPRPEATQEKSAKRPLVPFLDASVLIAGTTGGLYFIGLLFHNHLLSTLSLRLPGAFDTSPSTQDYMTLGALVVFFGFMIPGVCLLTCYLNGTLSDILGWRPIKNAVHRLVVLKRRSPYAFVYFTLAAGMVYLYGAGLVLIFFRKSEPGRTNPRVLRLIVSDQSYPLAGNAQLINVNENYVVISGMNGEIVGIQKDKVNQLVVERWNNK